MPEISLLLRDEDTLTLLRRHLETKRDEPLSEDLRRDLLLFLRTLKEG